MGLTIHIVQAHTIRIWAALKGDFADGDCTCDERGKGKGKECLSKQMSSLAERTMLKEPTATKTGTIECQKANEDPEKGGQTNNAKSLNSSLALPYIRHRGPAPQIIQAVIASLISLKWPLWGIGQLRGNMGAVFYRPHEK